jgi:hypothetical protein
MRNEKKNEKMLFSKQGIEEAQPIYPARTSIASRFFFKIFGSTGSIKYILIFLFNLF